MHQRSSLAVLFAHILAVPLAACGSGAPVDKANSSTDSTVDGGPQSDAAVDNDASVQDIKRDCGGGTRTMFASVPLCATDDGGATDGGADASVEAGTSSFPQCATPTDVENCQERCLAVLNGGAPKVKSCSVPPGGNVLLCEGEVQMPCGRRPAGLVPATPGISHGPVADYFVAMTQLEAASVDAFQILASELAQHGAPRHLVSWAEHAAHEEAGHARRMNEHAENAGAQVAPTAVLPYRPRSLEDIATENATEGCIVETYGALIAHWQAQHAGDEGIRSTFAVIAREETSHADLAWAVHAWLMTQLPADARERVLSKQRAAAIALREGARNSVAPELVRSVGQPDAAIAERLVISLVQPLLRESLTLANAA